MIKKHLFIISSLFLLFACDQMGGSRIKNIVDLTPKLSVDNEKDIIFNNVQQGEVDLDNQKPQEIAIAPNDIIAKPAIAKKVFYSVERTGFVSAYSLKENRLIWRTNIQGNILDRSFIGGGILYSSGKLYITNGTRYLVVLDAETGIEEFRKEFSDIIRIKPVMADNDRLLIQTVSNKLYAINTVNFNTLWVHESGIQTINSGDYVEPMLFADVVIASFTTGEIFAFDIRTGQPRWRYLLTNHDNVTLPGFVPSTVQVQPIIHNDFMYFATGNGKLVRLYLYTGLPVWTKEAHDIHSMMLHSDKLVITNNARQVAIIDTSNGEVNWVGNLITQENKQKRKIKASKFLTPFVTRIGNQNVVNIASNDGVLYSFYEDDEGKFSVWPKVSQIIKGARYQWTSCCDGKNHFITNRKVSKSSH